MGDSRRRQAREAAYDSYGNPQYYDTRAANQHRRDLFFGGNETGLYNPNQPFTGDPTNPLANQGGEGQNYQQIFNDIFPESNITSDMLQERRGELERHGITLVGPNAAGHFHKIELPDGSRIDVIGGVERGDNNKQWLVSRTASGQQLHGGGSGGGVYGSGSPGIPGLTLGNYGDIYNRFSEFADTGGFSPEDLQNIRARAVSPIRSIYSSARRELDRGKALAGDYAPNNAAAHAKLAREQSYAAADANTNVEAAIAQMVQKGRLAGMGGMAGIYGTTPALANVFGQQALQSQGMANQMANAQIANTINANREPNRFQEATGYAGNVAGLAAPFVPGGGMWSTAPNIVTDPYAPSSPYA